MKFLRFIIKNYRAITGPLEIDVDKRSLMPIIGINESGKTTILQAIFSFDHFNDTLNDNGRQLKDTSNLYKTTSPPATIEAQISSTRQELISSLEEEKNPSLAPLIMEIKNKRSFPAYITIIRNINSKMYSLPTYGVIDAQLQDIVARAIIKYLPYILYFDDFRDKFDEQIEINKASQDSPTGWLAIIEQLFKRTDKSLSVFTLASLEERQRKSILSKVENHLNRTLTKEWKNFRLEDTDALQIAINFNQQTPPGQPVRSFLKLDVIETDATGDKHYFFVSDRSKGFFWFFNFVMKLEFNPKVISEDDKNTIYLLDEPGSYLHASAQAKLCVKLKNLSEKNRVIYCTHSHYLLDPETIPFGNIVVADKDSSGNITITPVHEYKGNITEKHSAFQPVIDALGIKPVNLNGSLGTVIITEGIIDYYAFEMFKKTESITILPSVGANSMKFFISLMIAWGVEFRALWDNDPTGRKAKIEAEGVFGEIIAKKSFHLLPVNSDKGACILQNLFLGADIILIRNELNIPQNSSFDKTITELFYSNNKTTILSKISSETKNSFVSVYQSLRM